MSGQQSIVDNIVIEAEQRAKQLIAEAQVEADAILCAAREVNDGLGAKLLEKARQDAKSIIAAKLVQTNLEIRRKTLACRNVAIEQAFDRAKKRILSLGEADYLNYVKKQIMAHACDNDIVVVSKADEKRITADFVNGIAKQMGIKLTLSADKADFEGGVVLKSTYWDCNMTIESNFKVFREEYEQQVSKMLLGEGNV